MVASVFALLLTLLTIAAVWAASRFTGRCHMRLKLESVACIVVTGLLCANARSSTLDVTHEKTSAQLALLNRLRVCLNVDGAKAVSAAVVTSCPKKDVEVLVGISRDDLFSALGKPAACSHTNGSSEIWSDNGCRDAADVYYLFWPPCNVGPGIAQTLNILFSSAGGVTRSRWERDEAWTRVWVGPVTCVA